MNKYTFLVISLLSLASCRAAGPVHALQPDWDFYGNVKKMTLTSSLYMHDGWIDGINERVLDVRVTCFSESGQFISNEYYDGEGNLIQKEVGLCTDDGRELGHVSYGKDGEFIERMDYLARNDTLIVSRFYDEQNAIKRTVSLRRDWEGGRIKAEYSGESQKEDYLNEQYWSNRWVRTFQYDDKGYLISLKMVLPDGEEINIRYEYINFDKYGNWLERIEYRDEIMMFKFFREFEYN